MRLELTPTMHGAMLRVTFPSISAIQAGADAEKRVCFAEAEWTEHGAASTGSVPFITGKNLQAKQDRMIISGFTMFIRAESESAVDIDVIQDMICFRYKRTADVVTVRIATSLISSEQAKVNLNRELPLSRGFVDLLVEAKGEWNRMLRRVDVVDPGPLTEVTARHLTVFYTGLVRALSFPR